MFVSHLSSFLFYLYVSASVQCKNRLARDKSFLAIPTMRLVLTRQIDGRRSPEQADTTVSSTIDLRMIPGFLPFYYSYSGPLREVRCFPKTPYFS